MTTVTAPAPIPTFDEDAGGRKVFFICSKGSLDMAYPGLVLANAALGEGAETHLFFTFWGLDIISTKTMDHLQFSAVGNPAAHMPTALMGLPGMQAFATKMMRKQINEIDVPSVPEFLEAITDAGGHLWACRLAADMRHITEDDLYERVEGIITASEFIEKSDGAQIIFI